MEVSLGFAVTLIYLIASCDGYHAGRLLNPEHLGVLLTGSISHTSMRYMDLVQIFNVSLDLSTIDFASFKCLTVMSFEIQ